MTVLLLSSIVHFMVLIKNQLQTRKKLQGEKKQLKKTITLTVYTFINKVYIMWSLICHGDTQCTLEGIQ